MKNLKIGIVVFLLAIGFVVNASATSTAYYTATKVTFTDIAEFASGESDFGLYSIVDSSKRFQVFGANKEPLSTKTVKASQWTYLDEGFGFYFGVHTGGKSDASIDYIFFSDPLLNQYVDGAPVDTSLQHVVATYLPQLTTIKLEDQLGLGDKDFNDMIVAAFGDLNQITPGAASVPEPATMLLFGAGIVGLAGFSRQKKA